MPSPRGWPARPLRSRPSWVPGGRSTNAVMQGEPSRRVGRCQHGTIGPMDFREPATDLLRRARALGADAADVLIAEGTDFSVTVRRGEVETLKEAGSKAAGLRVFIGRRTATSYTSDFSADGLETLVGQTVDMARVTGEDAAAGLPDETPPAEEIDLGMFDPSPAALPTADRIER